MSIILRDYLDMRLYLDKKFRYYEFTDYLEYINFRGNVINKLSEIVPKNVNCIIRTNKQKYSYDLSDWVWSFSIFADSDEYFVFLDLML